MRRDRISVLVLGALSREFRDGLLAENERIEITGWIDPSYRRWRVT